MNLRVAIFGLIDTHQLSSDKAANLWKISGFDDEPYLIERHFWRAALLVAALLLGLGLIFWIAANWGHLTRLQQFIMLQSAVGLFCVGALFKLQLRAPLLLGRVNTNR